MLWETLPAWQLVTSSLSTTMKRWISLKSSIGLICEYVFLSYFLPYISANVIGLLFQIYELRVMETKPDKAVSIIECDMNVKFIIQSKTTVNDSVYSSSLNVFPPCFSGGFWCSFGLQRAWATTSAPGGTNSKDQSLKVPVQFTLWTNWLNSILHRRRKQIPLVTPTWIWDLEWVNGAVG